MSPIAPPEFTPLEGPELDCALRIIERAGLPRAAFVLEERCTRQPVSGQHVVAAWKLIRIVSSATGMQRQYGTGRDGGWPYAFERDVRCGLYSTNFPAAPGARMGVSGS